MLSKISFGQSNWQISNNSGKYSSIKQYPIKDSVSFSACKNTNISSELETILDNQSFTFKKHDGSEFKGTIREYLNDSIINPTAPIREVPLIHCTATKEIAEDIIQNGLDWTKTGRMKCGPGTYFSLSMADSIGQGAGSVAIQGEYTGDQNEMGIFEPCFYTAIEGNKEILDLIKKTQGGNENKILNEYCHNILMNEMGYDIIYAASGRTSGAYVVLNDNCMKLSKYNW